MGIPPKKASNASAFAADAALGALQPLATLLLEQGLGVPELYQALKWVFVQESARQATRDGRKVNVSRIAAQTGLTRQEVSRLLRNTAKPETRYAWQRQRSNRVLLGWHTDATFLTAAGQPRGLPYEGERSFTRLARAYSGDIPPRAMLEELLDRGAVVERHADQFFPLSRTIIDPRSSPATLLEIGRKLKVVAGAIIAAADDTQEPVLYQELALSQPMNARKAREITAALNRRSANFMELSQRLLAAADTAPATETPSPDDVTVGLFVTVIQQEAQDEGNS